MPHNTEDFSIHQLDAVDLLLLRELQKNARITIKELAEKVNLSTTPVFERWRRLEQLGYIDSYVTMLNPEMLGHNFSVFCMVKLQRLNNIVANKFVHSVARIPEVSECYSISGDYDYLLKITVPNMKVYKEFVINVLGHLDLIGSMESHFVLDVIKCSRQLPL